MITQQQALHAVDRLRGAEPAQHLATLRQYIEQSTAQPQAVVPAPPQEFESAQGRALAVAWAEGWAQCRDAEYVGEDAQDEAFNQSATLAQCLHADQTRFQGGLSNDQLRRAWSAKLPNVIPTDEQLTAFALGIEVAVAQSAPLAQQAAQRDAALARVAEVGPVGEVVLNYSSQLERCHPDGDMNEVQWLEGSPTPSAGTMLYPASTVASLTAQRDAAMARVAELEKDAEPDEFTRGIDAAAKMLDKMADDYSNEHAVQDSDTGVYEFGRGGKEDYYNTLRELADDILSIVYAPGEREKTAQTLKAAKDAAFEQAANLLECEYAEDAKQKRRLDQIAQHIRDLKKRSS